MLGGQAVQATLRLLSLLISSKPAPWRQNRPFPRQRSHRRAQAGHPPQAVQALAHDGAVLAVVDHDA